VKDFEIRIPCRSTNCSKLAVARKSNSNWGRVACGCGQNCWMETPKKDTQFLDSIISQWYFEDDPNLVIIIEENPL
jgi:hypothetical protein